MISRRAFLAAAGGLAAASRAGAQPGPDFAEPPSEPAALMPVSVAVPGNVFARTDRGVASGIVAETVGAVLQRIGFQPIHVTMPPADSLPAVALGEIDVACMVTGVADDVLLTNPIVIEYGIVAVRTGERFELGSIADLRARKVGARDGYPLALAERDPAVAITRFDSAGELLRALVYGQIDTAIISGLSDLYTFRSEGIINRISILARAVGATPIRAALSPERFSHRDLAAFNSELSLFRQEGEWQQIIDRNGFGDLVRDWPLVAA